jgi:hypothetical protein
MREEPPTGAARTCPVRRGKVDGEREARLTGAGWRMVIQRKGGKDKRSRKHRRGATSASPGLAHASSTCSPGWPRLVRKR